MDPEKIVLNNICLKRLLEVHCFKRDATVVEGIECLNYLDCSHLETTERSQANHRRRQRGVETSYLFPRLSSSRPFDLQSHQVDGCDYEG